MAIYDDITGGQPAAAPPPPTEYMTPDGRRVSLPPDTAASFADLTPAAPPVPAAPPASPPPQQGAGKSSTPVISDLGRSSAVTSPSQVSPDGISVPSSGPPLTNAQLIKQGPAGVLASENKALDEQKAAVLQGAQVDADTATQQGHALAERDAQTQRILEERAKAAADNMAKLNARIAERDAAAKTIANTRIDRGVDHPVWAALAVALGAVGGAMQQKAYGGQFHNAAFDTLMQQIDRKVAAQMADLDNKRKALGEMTAGIGEQRQMGADRLNEIDVRRDAALQQAKQMVETMATQMKSPAALANAQLLSGKIDEVRAQNQGTAAERIQAQLNAEAQRNQAAQQHRETVAIERARMKQEDEHFYYGKAQEEREKLATIAQQMLERGDKESAAKAKLASEQGIVDPSTGNLMLSPAGEEKMRTADSYEAKARKTSDPAEAAKLNSAAADLRSSAQVNDAAIGINKKASEEAQATANAAHDITTKANKVIGMLESGPGTLDRETWQRLTISIDAIKRAYAQGGKERLSPLALNSMEDIIGLDPGKVSSRIADKGKAVAALKQLRDQMAESAVGALRGAGIKSNWTPGRTEESASFTGKTADELAADAEPGGLLKPLLPGGGEMVGGLRDYSLTAQDRARDEANARRGAPSRAYPEGRTSDYGLDPAVDEAVRGLVARADTAGHAAYANIVQQLAVPLAETKRPGLDTGVARLLRDTDPKVFSDVLSAVAASAGSERAKELSDAIARPDATRAPEPGAITTSAKNELKINKERIKLGLPGGTYSDAPAVWQTLTPEGKARFNRYLQDNGFPPVKAVGE